MAQTDYGVNHALAVKRWRRDLFKEALKRTQILKFMGKSSNSVIQLLDDTSKGAGDKITQGLRMQLAGDGVQGDGTLEGNEEALVTYSDSIFINQLRHATRSKGKMSEQRVPFSVREEGRDGLADWWADRFDTWGFNQLAGYTVQSDTRFTGNQATIAPSASRLIIQGQSAESSLTSSDTFTLDLVDNCVEMASTATPVFRSVRMGAEDKYVMFLHPYQVTDLRTNTSTGQWLDIQKAAMSGGQITKNPIYTGALGEYNGVILHSSTRLPNAVSSGAAMADTKRAVFCGAQAGMMAFGRGDSPDKMNWVEELFDFKNQLGVSAGCIAGLKKCVFNSVDFGTIVVSTYAAAHTT